MISVISLVTVLSLAQTTKKADTKLIDLTPVTQVAKSSVFKLSKEFSIGGVVLKEGIQLQPQGDAGTERSGRLVYTVPRGAVVFRGQYGIPDTDSEGTGEATLGIFVDGEAVQEIRNSSGQKPVSFEVPLTNAKSIMLQFTGTASIAEAIFSQTLSTKKPPVRPPQPAQQTPTKTTSDEMGRVNLKAPENGASATNSVTFQWDAIPGAINYGIEIVMISNADPKKTPSRFLRAFSAKGESFEWNFSDDVISGDYQVSVIAFGKQGVLTKFSNSRRFKVTRK